MEELHLYHQIAEAIRRDILDGKLKPGDKLPSVRELSRQWGCTQGTVQRAYRELANQGIVESRAGKGTQVCGILTPVQMKKDNVLRMANLVNQSEEFLLEEISKGYSLDEIQRSIFLAMDRWKALENHVEISVKEKIRFMGSHDPVINSLAQKFNEILPGYGLSLHFMGSMGGLRALAEHKSDLAGCHLWDETTETYNIEDVKKIFKNEKMVLLTLATRRLGLILPPGNPLKIRSIADIIRKRVRFANRQKGSGTRIWFDNNLAKIGLAPDEVIGYDNEYSTHSEIGRVIAEGSAGVGIGVESVAIAYGLDFVYLTKERYDLVFYFDSIEKKSFKFFINWLQSEIGKSFISQFPGYENNETGMVRYSV